jgi:cysteine desulfurase / selenocysteine lyase
VASSEPGASRLDVRALRAQFPVTRRHAYFDHATFGPPPTVCVEAATACWRALSEASRLPVPWDQAVESVRASAARLFGCAADDIAFVKSSAEAMSLVALGLDWRPGDEVVVYEEQFPSGVLPWLNLARRGVRVRFVRDRGRHRFDADDVLELLRERTRVVCLELVNFGNGFRVPVEAVAAGCRRHGAWLLVDATQAAGVLAIDVARLGCDLLAAHGYKFLASGYGVAPCYVAPELRRRLPVVEPGWRSRDDLTGGRSDTDYGRVRYRDEAWRFEPSIPNVAGIVGMGASLDLLQGLGPPAIEARALGLAAAAADALEEIGFRVESSRREGERSAILSVQRDGVDPDQMEAGLLAAGVATAVRERRLRLSFHCYNDEADLERLVATLGTLARRRA